MIKSLVVALFIGAATVAGRFPINHIEADNISNTDLLDDGFVGESPMLLQDSECFFNVPSELRYTYRIFKVKSSLFSTKISKTNSGQRAYSAKNNYYLYTDGKDTGYFVNFVDFSTGQKTQFDQDYGIYSDTDDRSCNKSELPSSASFDSYFNEFKEPFCGNMKKETVYSIDKKIWKHSLSGSFEKRKNGNYVFLYKKGSNVPSIQYEISSKHDEPTWYIEYSTWTEATSSLTNEEYAKKVCQGYVGF